MHYEVDCILSQYKHQYNTSTVLAIAAVLYYNTPAHHRIDPSILPGRILRLLLPLLDFWSVPIPGIKGLLGRLLADAPVSRQSVHRLAVRDGEVQRLCFATL